MTDASLRGLLDLLGSGRARGLDVMFQRLGESGPYRPAPVRYPLAEVDPLRPNLPGGPATAPAELARRLEGALPEARTEEARLTLLERFGGYVAAVDARGQEVGGVSWFDRARLDAALAACGERVLALRADLSGIQDFIYRVESDRALKSLRARSFYLELLAVHALRHLLALGGVTRANVAYLGGGGFQVYLPAGTEAAVRDYARAFDDWLWAEHAGRLGFSLALTTVTPGEAREGGAFQRALSADLGQQKARRRRGRLAEVFAEVGDPTRRRAREDALDEALAALGGRLPGATHVEVREPRDVEGSGWVVLHDRAYRSLRAGPATPLPPERLALNALTDPGAFPMLSGNYVTRVGDIPRNLRTETGEDPSPQGVATHEQLVDLALGQPRLALYRCDADNMGRYFAGGIPGHDAARHATLSRLMGLFFQGYVNAVCGERGPLLPGLVQAERSATPGHGRYLNIIYSGGDDAVVVGAWNEVLTFAVDLRRAYARFTGDNPRLGLSGGSFVAKAKFPLNRMAERAHDAEGLAKQARQPGSTAPTPDKDGFVPFLHADAPDDDPRAATRWNVFAPLTGNGGGGIEQTLGVLSAFLALRREGEGLAVELHTRRAFLWKLQAFAEREGDVWRLPLLHYALARATPPAEAQREWQALQRTLLTPDTWPHLGNVLAFLHLARPTPQERTEA